MLKKPSLRIPGQMDENLLVQIKELTEIHKIEVIRHWPAVIHWDKRFNHLDWSAFSEKNKVKCIRVLDVSREDDDTFFITCFINDQKIKYEFSRSDMGFIKIYL